MLRQAPLVRVTEMKRKLANLRLGLLPALVPLIRCSFVRNGGLLAALLMLGACEQESAVRPALAPAPNTPTDSPVSPLPVQWMDDFLGVSVDGRYAQSLSGTGTIAIAQTGFIGGVLQLATRETGEGSARLRLGEEPRSGGLDIRSFSVEKHVTVEARVQLNSMDQLAATVGLVGRDDPDHVIAAIFNPADAPTWQFQVHNGMSRATVSTTFQHSAGAWATFRIVTRTEPDVAAILYINGIRQAVVLGQPVPLSGLSPEVQLWNQPVGRGWSQTSLWMDYLRLQQDR